MNQENSIRGRLGSIAEGALMYYKGCAGISEKERSLVKLEFERLKLIAEERKLNNKLQFKDFCNRKALKGIVTSIAMAWFVQFTGCFLFMNYASMIFEKSGSSLDSHVSSIILAVAQIVAGLVSTQLGDTFGRKTSLFISLSGGAGGLFTLSAYSYLRHIGYDLSNFLWVPVVCLSFIIFISSVGIIALAHICAIENFPSKIRTFGVVLYSLCVSTVAFMADKYFPILLEAIHLHGCLLFFAISCVFGVIFVAFNQFKESSLDNRDDFVRKNALCKNCFSNSHPTTICPRGPCPHCATKHNCLLRCPKSN